MAIDLRKKFINAVASKVHEIDAQDSLLLHFKIIFAIHIAHEKLKRGIMSPDVGVLKEYYNALSPSSKGKVVKEDVIFYNKDKIPYVYSVFLDKTFPLIEYPFHLYVQAGYDGEMPPTKDLIEFYNSISYDINDPKYHYLELFLKKNMQYT